MAYYYCDCLESNEAKGFKVSPAQISNEIGKLVLVEVDKDEACVHCGHYAVYHSVPYEGSARKRKNKLDSPAGPKRDFEEEDLQISAGSEILNSLEGSEYEESFSSYGNDSGGMWG